MHSIASIAGRCAIFAFLFLVAADAAAFEGAGSVGEDAGEPRAAVKVYPDGGFDWEYVKDCIPYIDYVRDRMDAELYLLITNEVTGSGGYEYTITIIGQRQFAGMSDTLAHYAGAAEAWEVERAGVAKALKMALMRYVARTPIGEDITIAYRSAATMTAAADPWDRWVFSLSFSPNVSGSQVDESRSFSGSVSADRVTRDLKLSFRAYSSYSESEQTLPSKTVHLIRRRGSFDALAVKSVGVHWGIGLIGDGLMQSYQNKKSYYEISPAIEYSIFPYAQSTRREFAVFAQIIYTGVVYQELTIYDKIDEKLLSYRVNLPVYIKEPWGTIRSSVSWQQYFHDASIYRLSISPMISFQVAKGLWFNVMASYYRLHDRIDQPRRTLTDEEILLNLKSLASTYEYSFGVGFSYTFGSIYSNVVNPRFFGD
jgi:hypothetical protein